LRGSREEGNYKIRNSTKDKSHACRELKFPREKVRAGGSKDKYKIMKDTGGERIEMRGGRKKKK